MMSHHPAEDHHHFGPVKFSQASNRFGAQMRVSLNNPTGAAQKEAASKMAAGSQGHQNLRTMESNKDSSIT